MYSTRNRLLQTIFSPGIENENKTSQHILDRWSLSHYLFGQMLKVNFNKLTTKQNMWEDYSNGYL